MPRSFCTYCRKTGDEQRQFFSTSKTKYGMLYTTQNVSDAHGLIWSDRKCTNPIHCWGSKERILKFETTGKKSAMSPCCICMGQVQKSTPIPEYKSTDTDLPLNTFALFCQTFLSSQLAQLSLFKRLVKLRTGCFRGNKVNTEAARSIVSHLPIDFVRVTPFCKTT